MKCIDESQELAWFHSEILYTNQEINAISLTFVFKKHASNNSLFYIDKLSFNRPFDQTYHF